MPFSPLPATFIDDVARCGPGDVLELGSGHGAFTGVLGELGCRPWTLDRIGPPLGGRPDVVGDALCPPLRGSFPLIVASNLLRHAWPELRSGGPMPWRDLLAPGGCLWIFEDEPCDRPASAANYRRLQDLLVLMQPGDHRPLLRRHTFESASRNWAWPGSWSMGTQDNTWPADVERVTAMLASGRPAAGGPVAELLDDLERAGLSYGRYWWACWTAEAS